MKQHHCNHLLSLQYQVQNYKLGNKFKKQGPHCKGNVQLQSKSRQYQVLITIIVLVAITTGCNCAKDLGDVGPLADINVLQ